MSKPLNLARGCVSKVGRWQAVPPNQAMPMSPKNNSNIAKGAKSRKRPRKIKRLALASSPPNSETRIESASFVAAVEAIYSTAAQPDMWPNALQATADVFEDIGANLIWRRDDGSFGTIVSPALRMAQLDYEAGWWRQDIRAIRAIEYAYRSAGGPITEQHVVSPEEIESHPFFTEFQQRHGLKWIASVQISPDPRIVVAISVQRAPSKPPYGDEELSALSRLGRHAEHALRLGIRILNAEATNIGLADALTRVGLAAFVLDGLGRVVFSNLAANRLIDNGLSIVNQRLMARTPSDCAALDSIIKKMIARWPENLVENPTPIIIQRGSESHPLVIYVLPIAMSVNSPKHYLADAKMIVLAVDQQARDPVDPALVRDLLGLTLGEARVASLVGAGLPPREAAHQLGISEETARTSLKRVFAKVGIARQSELAVMLTKLTVR
jgi:DNA-binding CsgD family transcriptional regulator